MNAYLVVLAILFLISGLVTWKLSNRTGSGMRDLGIVLTALGILGLIVMAVKIVYFILVP